MAGPPYIDSDGVTIYYTDDRHLSRVLIFYWPVTTAGSSVSSRHRVTILTKIGHASFPPFQVSPQSSYYGAVAQLTDERQREEIYRVMVFSLAKYFDTLPAASKENGYDYRSHTLYDDRHAGVIANKLCKVTNPAQVIEDVQSFYSSSTKLQQSSPRPTSSSRSTTFSSEQKQAVRLAMCEVVDTEERYVSKMHELLSSIIAEFREKSCIKPATTSNNPSEEAVSKLFPSCLDAIFTVNRGFLDSIRHVLETTEDSALDCIAVGDDANNNVAAKAPSHVQDPLGIRAFSKVLTTWFPKFLYPYREYLYAHTSFSPILTSLMKNHSTSSFSRRVRETGGEQRLRSILMEPVQRLPRYSLLIDSMSQPLPAVGEEMSLKLLAKARDVVAEICAMETPVSKVLEALSISYEEEVEKKESGYIRSLSPAKLFSSRSAAAAEEQHSVVLRNVPRLVARDEDKTEIAKDRDRERERGREKFSGGGGVGGLGLGGGGGGSLRRAWSRRVSPPKREQSHHNDNQYRNRHHQQQQQHHHHHHQPPSLKENVSPSRSVLSLAPLQEQQAQQKQYPKPLQDTSAMTSITMESEKLRRENTALRELLEKCTCGAGDGGGGGAAAAAIGSTATTTTTTAGAAGAAGAGAITPSSPGGRDGIVVVGEVDERRTGSEFHRSF